jgi:hypothetical protein
MLQDSEDMMAAKHRGEVLMVLSRLNRCSDEQTVPEVRSPQPPVPQRGSHRGWFAEIKVRDKRDKRDKSAAGSSPSATDSSFSSCSSRDQRVTVSCPLISQERN